jgi:hypothetical protein
LEFYHATASLSPTQFSECYSRASFCQRQFRAQTWFKKSHYRCCGRFARGEAEELVREAVDIAKAGDVVMLKFLLSRILPRERAIKLDLPAMNFADDAVAVLGAVFDAVTEGRITASEGAALASLIDTYTRAIDMADVVKRLDFLESKVNGGGR